MSKKTTLLCILDGVGIAPPGEGNALSIAETPVLDDLFATAPNSSLKADGKAVGLPEGQMGNSEVGHITIGAGRVIKQSLVRITDDLEEGSFSSLPGYQAFVNDARDSRALHLAGLFSDGGIHSHTDHVKGLCQLLNGLGKPVFIHAFTDGRDTGVHDGKGQVEEFQRAVSDLENVHIATVSGRFYSMDRDSRWERTEAGWNLLTKLEGEEFDSAEAVFDQAYGEGLSDEHIRPSVIKLSEDLDPRLQDGDAVFLFNFRADRVRQLTRCLLGLEGVGFDYKNPDLKAIASMTLYDEEFKSKMHVVYPPEKYNGLLGQVVSEAGLSQLRIAETEKYAHVTFFLNNGREEPFEHEDRILVSSPREVRTYDEKPEMSLPEVSAKVQEAIKSGKYDLIVLNIANGDMVGHCGDMAAALQAAVHIDNELGKILKSLEETDGEALIIADHGNIEQMIEGDGICTTHTTNPVPCIYSGKQDLKLSNGALSDVAPTILKLMGLSKPEEMTGHSLF